MAESREHWVLQDIDAEGQPSYGPFPSKDAAEAFGELLDLREHRDWAAFQLNDPQAVINQARSAVKKVEEML